jgi:hypothetical protein
MVRVMYKLEQMNTHTSVPPEYFTDLLGLWNLVRHLEFYVNRRHKVSKNLPVSISLSLLERAKFLRELHHAIINS